MKILQLVPVSDHFLGLYAIPEEPGWYVEPLFGLALLEAGSRNALEPLAVIDGSVVLASENDDFLGTYHHKDPSLLKICVELEKKFRSAQRIVDKPQQ